MESPNTGAHRGEILLLLLKTLRREIFISNITKQNSPGCRHGWGFRTTDQINLNVEKNAVFWHFSHLLASIFGSDETFYLQLSSRDFKIIRSGCHFGWFYSSQQIFMSQKDGECRSEQWSPMLKINRTFGIYNNRQVAQIQMKKSDLSWTFTTSSRNEIIVLILSLRGGISRHRDLYHAGLKDRNSQHQRKGRRIQLLIHSGRRKSICVTE